MKPPRKKHSRIHVIPQHLSGHAYVNWRKAIDSVVMTQTFAQPNEYAAPAMRAVWSAVDQHKGEEDDENRRKRR